ncbi:MAG TPA: hypothetical protein VJV78_43320 [Polyangiales bacterium]|nr:hypothetical protein [Polyangiales bacterium]
MSFWRKLKWLAFVCCIVLVAALALSALPDEDAPRTSDRATQTYFEN